MSTQYVLFPWICVPATSDSAIDTAAGVSLCVHVLLYLPLRIAFQSIYITEKLFVEKQSLRRCRPILRPDTILVLFLLNAFVCYAFRHSAVVFFLNLMTQLIDCYLEENNTPTLLPPSRTTTNLMDIIERSWRRASCAFALNVSRKFRTEVRESE